jgi:hypothetical protein
MFARLETDAIDETSAIELAGETLDDHLLTLNALFSSGHRQLIQVSRSNRQQPTFSAIRAAKLHKAANKILAGYKADRMPLMVVQLENSLKDKLGARLSRLLASDPNEFEQRILSGYALAGAACVDPHPERRFMMYAIALESVVLGKDVQAELTYQLGARLAHLIGNGLRGRQAVASAMNALYRRRSRIVHTGAYGVPRSEASLLWFYCTVALSMLLMSPAFEGFKSNKELEAWFTERMLEGPNHYSPESVASE